MVQQADLLGMTSGFIQAFIGGLAQKENQQRSMLVDTINSAVASGQPEAIEMLNPELLDRFGFTPVMPAYIGFATAMKQKNEMAMREMVAKTGLAESQARVAAAVEEPTIQSAKQKAAIGGIELQQAEAINQAMVDNPRLLMLPQEKVMKEIEFTDAKIKAQAEETKLQWAQLGEMTRHHKASEARMGAAAAADKKQSPLEAMMLAELQKLPPEERSEVMLQKFAPGIESNFQKKINMYSRDIGTAQKNVLALQTKITDRAAKEGKEPLQYGTEQAAMADMSALNGAIASYNSIADAMSKLGEERPQLPMFEIAPIPGRIYGVKGYQLITKQSSLADELKSIGIDLGSLGKPKGKAEEKTTPTVEKPVLAPQSGRRITPETNRARRTEEPSQKRGGL